MGHGGEDVLQEHVSEAAHNRNSVINASAKESNSRFNRGGGVPRSSSDAGTILPSEKFPRYFPLN